MGPDDAARRHHVRAAQQLHDQRDTRVSGDGEVPTYQALHETVEITHGFNGWTELGFYWFMAKPTARTTVGRNASPPARQRPRELGMAGRAQHLAGDRLGALAFLRRHWTYELRPIIDKEWAGFTSSINPVLGKSLRGPSVDAVRVHAERECRVRSHQSESMSPSSTTARLARSSAPSRSPTRSTCCTRRQFRSRPSMGVQLRLWHRNDRRRRQKSRQADSRTSSRKMSLGQY